MTLEASVSAIVLSVFSSSIRALGSCISFFSKSDGMSPTDWAKAITDFGVTVIITGLFLYIIFRLVNVGVKYLEGKVGNKQHDKLLDLRNEIGDDVQGLLEDYVTSHKGERAQVIEFSNTVMSVAYLPFKYMTCTYEVCSFGVPSKGHTIDHMSTSLFTHFFRNLREHDYCIFDVNSKELFMGGAMFDLMKNLDQERVLCTMLTTHSGKAIGYLSFQKSSEYTEQDVEDFEKLGKQITALLGVMDN